MESKIALQSGIVPFVDTEEWFKTRSFYQQCRYCKTTFHMPTMINMMRESNPHPHPQDWVKKDGTKQDGWFCVIDECNYCPHSKTFCGQINTWREGPSSVQMVERLEALYDDYVNLKAMETEFNELKEQALLNSKEQ